MLWRTRTLVDGDGVFVATDSVEAAFVVATFDTAGIVWQEWRPGAMRWDIENILVAPILETTMTFTPTAGKRWMTVCFLALEVAVDDPTPWKPLQAGL